MDPDKPPFAIGQRVRLRKPDNAGHPRKGYTGQVVSLRWYEPVCKWSRGEPTEIEPACWMVRVLIKKATWADWRARGESDDAWSLFARELEAVR